MSARTSKVTFAKKVLLFRQIIVSLILVSLLGQSLHRALIVTSYYTNTAAYLKNCINKTKPQLRCKGKCQLKKQLQEENAQDEQQPERRNGHTEEFCLSSKSFFPSLSIAITTPQQNFSILLIGQIIKMPRSLLRPPDNQV